MKKVIYILATVAVSTTLMMGCGSKTATTENTESNQTRESAPTDNGPNKQDNFQKADLEGEVTSVSGNKISLKIIKSPEKPSNDGQKPSDNGVEPSSDGGQKITDNKGGPNSSESKTLSASTITVGNVLQITYSDEAKETISSINVMPSENQNGNANTGTTTK